MSEYERRAALAEIRPPQPGPEVQLHSYRYPSPEPDEEELRTEPASIPHTVDPEEHTVRDPRKQREPIERSVYLKIPDFANLHLKKLCGPVAIPLELIPNGSVSDPRRGALPTNSWFLVPAFGLGRGYQQGTSKRAQRRRIKREDLLNKSVENLSIIVPANVLTHVFVNLVEIMP